MLAFKPLFQRDIPSQNNYRQVQAGNTQQTPAAPVASGSKESIQNVLTLAYQRLEATVQGRFPATKEATAPADASVPADDYSPQAVADRIVGFIKDRLAQEKAAGASPERLKSLYQQALKGVEQGLREGRDIIKDKGLYAGDAKDTYYKTVNKVADGLQKLGEELFGTGTQQPPANGSTETAGGFKAGTSQVAMERSRTFEMEVMTKEGDKVKIKVESGQSFNSNQVNFQNGQTSIDGFEASFSSFDNLSFSVEGDLNEEELAALNDLFGQVNDVAETFYGGDVEQAFDQAMSVGHNPEQLASFAVNMNQTETVAVRQTYVAVQNMGGSGWGNPYEDMFARLGDFAGKARAGADAVAANPESPANGRKMFADLIGRLHSGHGKGEGHGDAFGRFAQRLAS